jgi:hypothetical protein
MLDLMSIHVRILEYQINLASKMRMPDLMSILVRILEFVREYMIDLA